MNVTRTVSAEAHQIPRDWAFGQATSDFLDDVSARWEIVRGMVILHRWEGVYAARPGDWVLLDQDRRLTILTNQGFEAQCEREPMRRLYSWKDMTTEESQMILDALERELDATGAEIDPGLIYGGHISSDKVNLDEVNVTVSVDSMKIQEQVEREIREAFAASR